MLPAAAPRWTVSAAILTKTAAGIVLMLLDAVLGWVLKDVTLKQSAHTLPALLSAVHPHVVLLLVAGVIAGVPNAVAPEQTVDTAPMLFPVVRNQGGAWMWLRRAAARS